MDSDRVLGNGNEELKSRENLQVQNEFLTQQKLKPLYQTKNEVGEWIKNAKYWRGNHHNLDDNELETYTTNSEPTRKRKRENEASKALLKKPKQ